MRKGTVRWALLLPLLGYAGARLLLVGPPFGSVELLAAAALALPVSEVATDRLAAWAYLPGAAVVALLVVGALRGPAWLFDGLVVGALLGAPLGLAGVAWKVRASMAGAIVALVGAVELALVELSVATTVATAGVSASGWTRALTSILDDQGVSLTAFGFGRTIPPSPLATIPDAGFVVLALLPLAGFFVVALLPPRTPRADGAPTGSAAHAAALLVAVGAVGAMEVAAIVTTAEVALIGLTVAVAEALVALGVASWRPSARRRRPAAAPVRAPAPGPPLPR